MQFQLHLQKNDLCFGGLIAVMFSIMTAGITAGFLDLDHRSGIDSQRLAAESDCVDRDFSRWVPPLLRGRHLSGVGSVGSAARIRVPCA